MDRVKTRNNIARVLAVRHLTDTAFILRMERDGMEFEAGQYISLGLPGTDERREYTIYSGMHDAFLEVLVKEIDDGLVSNQLKQLRMGARTEMEGPFGYFTLGTKQQSGARLVFIASGTGIAPFHSYIKSYPSLDYRLIHGVRYGEESYESEKYDPGMTRGITGAGSRNILGRIHRTPMPNIICAATAI
jgi:ferredoxin--NADP+ reductase